MNRIQQRPPVVDTVLDEPSHYSELPRCETLEDEAQHCMFVPMHYEPRYRYPLIIWLHGRGGSESQLKPVMPLVSMRNFAAVAPRGTIAAERSPERQGYFWRQTVGEIELAEQRVFQCIELAMSRLQVEPSRVFLVGYADGGTMALRLGLGHPDRFAGVASIGGPLPQGHRPLKRVNEARQLPLLLSTSEESRQYPHCDVARDLRLLHSAGIGVTLRQYPCDDELTTVMLSDLNVWIMDQLASSASICRDPKPTEAP